MATVDSAHDVLSRVINWANLGEHQIGSLSILSHGAAGGFELGNEWITDASLASTASDWQQLSQYLTDDGRIEIFGCNVDANGAAQTLLGDLADLTNADIFASSNITGQGGDWILESSSLGYSSEDAAGIVIPFDIELLEATDATLAWYDTNWNYRKQITIDHTKVSSTETNFSILVNLSSDANLQAHALANGNDLVFTSADGTTKLDYEIEKYSSVNGELIAWIRIPTLSSTTDTVLFLYYGNASASNQQNATGVYDASTGRSLSLRRVDESLFRFDDNSQQ